MRHLRKRLRIASYKQAVRSRHPGATCQWRNSHGGHYAIVSAMSGRKVIETGRTKNEAWARAAGQWLKAARQ
jgi:hypothetical protein